MWPRLRARLWPPPPQRRVPYWGHQTGPDPLWHLQPVKPTKGKGCYLTVSWQECAEWTLSGTILQCAIKDKEGYKFRRQFSWNAVSQRLWRFWIRIRMQISSLKYLTLGIPPSPPPPKVLTLPISLTLATTLYIRSFSNLSFGPYPGLIWICPLSPFSPTSWIQTGA